MSENTNLERRLKAPKYLKLTSLTPVQGDLKERSQKDLQALMDDLVQNGQLSPFIVWTPNDKPELAYILDGHGRYQAYIRLAMNDPTYLEKEYPVVSLEASSLEEARHLLLHIDSRFGKITKSGLQQYLAQMTAPPDVSKMRLVAPTLKTAAPKAKPASPNPATTEPVTPGTTILRIKVPTDQKHQILQVLKTCSFVKVIDE